VTFAERIEVDRKQLLRGMVAFFSVLKDGKVPYPETYRLYYNETGEVNGAELLNILEESSEIIADVVRVSMNASVPELKELTRKALDYLERLDEFRKQVDFLNCELFKDHLTGLWNRRALEYYFEREVKAKAAEVPFVLAFVDLNDFKSVNDTYGHLAGDEFLRVFAGFLERNFPDSFVARYGGDEFVVLTENKLIPAVKKKFSEMIENAPVHLGRKISFAVGITNVVANDSLCSAVSRADAGMYRSKTTGKVEYVRR
jgi:diguanylate cyclase (GGDEF)-like protein